MLKLRKGRPEPIPVPLGGGAIASVRPATSFEVDLAIAGAGKLLFGLVQSQESASLAAEVLGEEFASADFTSKEWLDAAAQRIALLELANLCVESWTGVVDGDDNVIEKPSRQTLALVLRSNEAAMRIRAAIQSSVNVETSEGNALGASPNGAGLVGADFVPLADRTAANAHAG
jgi:hypothetical protein